MSECTGTAPATPKPDKDAETDVPAPKPEKKSNVGMILVIFALAGAAGAAYYYIKFVKGRKPKDEDMDFFDDEGYEEEPYINEDDEPQITEDAETRNFVSPSQKKRQPVLALRLPFVPFCFRYLSYLYNYKTIHSILFYLHLQLITP